MLIDLLCARAHCLISDYTYKEKSKRREGLSELNRNMKEKIISNNTHDDVIVLGKRSFYFLLKHLNA